MLSLSLYGVTSSSILQLKYMVAFANGIVCFWDEASNMSRLKFNAFLWSYVLSYSVLFPVSLQNHFSLSVIYNLMSSVLHFCRP